MINILRSLVKLYDITTSKMVRANSRAPRKTDNKPYPICVAANDQHKNRETASLDIGESTIAVRMVDQDGLMFKAECVTHAKRGYTSALYRISKMLRFMASVSRSKISGIDVGCIGSVDPYSGLFGDAYIPGWRGNNLAQDLMRRFRVPVAFRMTHTVGSGPVKLQRTKKPSRN
jgi:hypothetical protein